eukprot:1156706-Pelagomonas_calceolata.AAC.7
MKHSSPEHYLYSATTALHDSTPAQPGAQPPQLPLPPIHPAPPPQRTARVESCAAAAAFQFAALLPTGCPPQQWWWQRSLERRGPRWRWEV